MGQRKCFIASTMLLRQSHCRFWFSSRFPPICSTPQPDLNFEPSRHLQYKSEQRGRPSRSRIWPASEWVALSAAGSSSRQYCNSPSRNRICKAASCVMKGALKCQRTGYGKGRKCQWCSAPSRNRICKAASDVMKGSAKPLQMS